MPDNTTDEPDKRIGPSFLQPSPVVEHPMDDVTFTREEQTRLDHLRATRPSSAMQEVHRLRFAQYLYACGRISEYTSNASLTREALQDDAANDATNEDPETQ